MNYSSEYSGQYYQMQGGEVYVLRGDGKFAYAGANSTSNVGVQLTGYYKSASNGVVMYLCTNGGWINLNDGWINIGHSSISQYSQKDAQHYVNKIIKCNARILENNLFCARFSDKLTEDQKTELRSLQNRLESRNERLMNDGLCYDQQVSTPPGYSDLQAYLHALMNYSTVGAISTTTIIVAAVVIASLATAAYFAYKYMAVEAEQDVKYSDELTKTLMSKLTQDEYQQLMQETQGIVTKSKLISRLGGGWAVIKWGVLVFAGLILYNQFVNGGE